jgi:solute:Na+ symporter, SSS family
MTAIDWTVAIALLLGLIVIGFVIRNYSRSVADFLVGGRKIRKYLGLSSQRAEGVGLAGIAAKGQQGFEYGFAYMWISILLLVYVVPVFGILGFGIKRFRATKCMTVAQYIQERYRSKRLRLLVGFVLGLSGILNIAIMPKVEGEFLAAFLGLPADFHCFGFDISTVTMIVVILLFFAGLFTFLGGMITVVVTDYIQSVILFGTLIFVSFFTVFKIGVVPIHESLQVNLGSGAYNPFASSSYGVVWVLWVLLATTFVKMGYAPAVQKLASTDSPETARKMELISGFFGTGQGCLTLIIGIGALAFLGSTIPVGMELQEYHRAVSAIYLSQMLPTVLMGVALAAMLFASISTNDSNLLSWSTVLVNDIVIPLRGKPFSQKGHMRAVRVMVMFLVLFMLFFGEIYTMQQSIVNYLYMTGTIMAGVGITVIFGLYWKRATTAGAYAGMITCLLIPLGDIFGKQFLDNYPLSTQESGLYAMLGGIVMLILVSLLTGSGEAPGWVDYGKIVRGMDADEKARLAKKS